ncbi:MAG: hypothetical protein AAGA70_02570 [Pseudomonadota bacterium]
MVEIASPLTRKAQPGTFGAADQPGVILGTRPLRGLSQIAGWSDFEDAARPVLKAMRLPGLGDYRSAQRTEKVTAWRIAPDKMLLEGAGDLSGYASDALAVLDLGHARAVVTLGGPDARAVLSGAIALDTRETAFSAGCYLQTAIQHVGVVIQCIDAESFEIFVPATWSESIWDFLFATALRCGVLVKGTS